MNRIRTTIVTTVGLALSGVGLAAPAQAAPNACEGVSGCEIISHADIDGDGRATRPASVPVTSPTAWSGPRSAP